MTNTTNAPTPGFAIDIQADTDLGTAVLTVEDADGYYAPVNLAGTISEALEMATSDLRRPRFAGSRNCDLVLAPWKYKLWARGLEGTMRLVVSWHASQLTCEQHD